MTHLSISLLLLAVADDDVVLRLLTTTADPGQLATPVLHLFDEVTVALRIADLDGPWSSSPGWRNSC